MAVSEGIEVVPVYAILTSRQPEGVQVTLFNPAENGNLAYHAVPGNGAGGEIFQIRYFKACFQFDTSLIPSFIYYGDDEA